MNLRAELLSSGCSFDAEVTADYGDKAYTFTMACQCDAQGRMSFTVSSPESISGITGILSQDEGALTFDDVVLAFPLLADGQLSPVSAPWTFTNSLRGGYIRAAGEEEGLLRLTIDDSFDEDSLQLDVWLDSEDRPVRGEIVYAGRKILTIQISNFHIL